MVTQHPPSLPPCLMHTHTHAHTHAHTYCPPTPVPRSRTFLLPSPKPEQLSPPASSLPTHPGQTPWEAADASCQLPRKRSLPLLCGQLAGLPPPQGDRGRAGRVGSVGLGAAVGREHLSHMPPGVRGWGAPCLEAGLREVLAHTHKPRPSLGVTPKTPERRPRHAWGERGPSAQLLSAAEQCLQGRVVTLG